MQAELLHNSAFTCTCAAIVATWAIVRCVRNLIATRRRKRWAAEDRERIRQVGKEHARRDELWYAEFGHVKAPPAYDTSSDSRFDVANSAHWLAHLDKYGYVVIAEVATRSEVEHSHHLLWQFLEENTAMRRGNALSWTDEAFEEIGDPKKGICVGCDVGHSALCWFVRCLPAVRGVFEAIWATNELVVSFDGINIYRPGAQSRTRSGWWHVDQGRFKRGRHAIQGFVALTDATPASGGLCVMPGTHMAHDDLLTYAATNDRDHVRVPSPTINPLCRNPRLVTCLAGDLVLWDSRTVHCNTPALVDEIEAVSPTIDVPQPHNDELLRAAVYVCMTPASALSKEARARRRQAFAARTNTTHWPDHINEQDLMDKSVDATQIAAALDGAGKACRDLIG